MTPVHGRSGRYLLALAALAAGSVALAADRQPAAPYEDTFSGAELGPGWYMWKKPHQFHVENGMLVGIRTDPGHGANLAFRIPMADVDVEFDAKFSDPKGFSASFEDKSEEGRAHSHAGHVARLTVKASSAMMADEFDGRFNLALRERNLSKEELDKVLAPTRQNFKLASAANDGSWHTYRMEVRGQTVKVFYDGVALGELTSSGVANPNKSQFGLNVGTETPVYFDNLTITPR